MTAISPIRVRRVLSVVVAATALLVAAPIIPARAAPETPTMERLAGADRYATAAEISADTFSSGVEVAYLASGETFADALAGGPATKGEAPVLLTTRDSLPGITAIELNRLAAQRIVVLGGEAVVSNAVLAEASKFSATGLVTRLAGADRYGTATQVSAATFEPGVEVVYLASGLDFADALAGGAAAGGDGPVLITPPDWLPFTTRVELKRLQPERVVVLGGESSVSPVVLLQAAQATGAEVERVAGDDRYETAVAVVEDAFPAATDKPIYVATGVAFADALAAVPAAAAAGAPLLLVPGAVPDPVRELLAERRPSSLTMVGGTKSIPDLAAVRMALDIGAIRLTQVPEGLPPAPDAAAEVAVTVALAQLGKPYVWAGAGPDVFDCSGLVMFAWAAAGVDLPHNAEAQAAATTPVSVLDLQPGDIVYFGTPIGHDGLYIGGGKMVEAPRTGLDVRISPINRSTLVGAGRVVR